MFGYITVNKDTLSEENKKIYQSYYCGLCQTMRSQYGRRAQMALNYDMTFLIVLLTGLYEPDSVTRDGFVCSVHPTKKRTLSTNEITEYAAAMNIQRCIRDRLKQLYFYYMEHIEELPQKYLAMLGQGDDKGRIICDYISGMTDQYATTKFHEYFVPVAWEIDGY